MIILRSIDNKFVVDFHDKEWEETMDYEKPIKVTDKKTFGVKFINDNILNGKNLAILTLLSNLMTLECFLIFVRLLQGF